MATIRERIDANTIAGNESGIALTLAFDTGSTAGAFGSTFATVVVVGFGVNTTTATDDGCGRRTLQGTSTVGADVCVFTGVAALSTVIDVGEGFAADSTTRNLTCGTLTLAFDAGSTALTDVATGSTVVAVGSGIDTTTTAFGRCGGRALQSTSTVGADIGVFTSVVAVSTVVDVGQGITTHSTTRDLTGRTGTLAFDAGGTALTDVAAATTVIGVCLSVDTTTATFGRCFCRTG